ncbi:MAG: DUF2948 family protein [Pseudomonadota bacterium]
MTTLLKIAAMDSEDLKVVSAHVQDAVLKSSEIDFDARRGRLLMPVNRFAWEAPGAKRRFFKSFERRRSVIHVDKVSGLRSTGVNREDPEDVLSLLAITFAPETDDSAAGVLQFSFGGGAVLEAQVECIELRVTDLGAAWSTRARPKHGN